jgi:putative NADH-flavin reductase
MRLFVLGATGRTGKALVAQGLARGHEITAFGRSAFSGEADALRVVVGNPMQANDLAAALAGNDMVISVLGTRGLGATSVLADSVRATMEAMRCAGVRRLVILSSLLLYPNIGRIPRFLKRTFLRHHVHDQRAMEKQVTESDLDWTVLRAARFTNGAFTGRYVVNAESGQNEISGAPMSREDAACMALDTAEHGSYIRQIVRICGGSR